MGTQFKFFRQIRQHCKPRFKMIFNLMVQITKLWWNNIMLRRWWWITFIIKISFIIITHTNFIIFIFVWNRKKISFLKLWLINCLDDSKLNNEQNLFIHRNVLVMLKAIENCKQPTRWSNRRSYSVRMSIHSDFLKYDNSFLGQKIIMFSAILFCLSYSIAI